MERDFMGVAGNEQHHRQRAAEDDATRNESAFFGAGGPPPMDWSFASRAGAAPAVMSFRSAPREEQGLPQFSTFDGAKKQQTSRVLTHQRSFGAESHGSPQHTAVRGAYAVPPPQQQQQLHPSHPMYKVQQQQLQHQRKQQQQQHVLNGTFKQPPFAVSNAAVAASRVGVYARNMPKPKMAQLTIFYAGSVNVFNNVSPEKAHELMLLASRGSLPGAPAAVARSPDASFFTPAKVAAPEVSRSPDANFFSPAKVAAPEVSLAKQMLPQKQQRFSPPAPSISKPISAVPQAACLPKSTSSSNIDSTVPKSSSQFVVTPTSQPPSARPMTLASSSHLAVPPTSQPPSTHPVALAAATAAAIMPRAVPQARKASLARFLEKRKERVTTVAPYSPGKSPVESNDTVGSANDNSKSSCTGIAFSSNRDKSLCLGRPRNISFSGECPSTNLHI